MTDFDFLIPVPIAFIIFMQALHYASVCTIKLNKTAFITNLTAMLGFILLNQWFDAFMSVLPVFGMSLWLGLVVIMILSGIATLVPLSYFLNNPNRFTALPATLIASSQYFYMNGFREWWQIFGEATSSVIHFMFSNVPFLGVTSQFSPEDAVLISHPLFLVRIGKGCGGLESVFLFTLIFLLFVSLRERRMRAIDLCKIYFPGLLLMFCLNLTRIIVLFFLGIWMKMWLPHETAITIFKLVFHLNLGWLMYTVGLYYYFKKFAFKVAPIREHNAIASLQTLSPAPSL